MSGKDDALLVIPVIIKEQPGVAARALVDSGATRNIVDPEFMKRISLEAKLKETPEQAYLADDTVLTSGLITHEVELTLMVGRGFAPYKGTFELMPLGPAPIILGKPFFLSHEPQIDYRKQMIRPSDGEDAIRVQSTEIVPTVPKAYLEYADVFSEEAAAGLPDHRSFDHRMPLMPGKTPPHGPLYKLSENERKVLNDYIDENLKKGFIRYSESQCSSPVLFVKKKDLSLRLCVDYRGLNAITVKNRYPLPLIQDLLDRLGLAVIFTRIDLRGAYNLIRIAAGEEWKTAFRTHKGLFKYLVMPFGLTNAPATFQHLMNYIFRKVDGTFVIVFLDDILIFSKKSEDHEGHVKYVLQKLREFKLYAKLSKCEFSTPETEFLGFVVGRFGIKMSPAKAESILDWPAPPTLTDLRGFVGLINFYRKFIPNFSEIAGPLHLLTRKDVPYVFGPAQRKAFDTLKGIVGSDQVLRHYSPRDRSIIETDASDYAVGAVFSQIDIKGESRPVAFASRKFKPAELNYPVHEKELTAIVFAFEEWRHYLEGVEHQVLVLTDHKSLEYFMTTKQLTRRQARWSEFLSEFSFEVKYRPGTQATKPDAMSRRSDYRPQDLEATSLSPELNPHNYRAVIAAVRASRPIDISSWSYEPELETLRSMYAKDGEYAQLMFHLREDTDSELRLDSSGILQNSNSIYVPKELRTRILWLCHDEQTAGHPGRAKTLDRLTPKYWWPTIKHDATDYVTSCIECQQHKSSRQKPLGLLKPLPVPDKPWQHVSADFIVQLPDSDGYDAILVIVDRFTKMAVFVPTTVTITSQGFAELFHEFVYCRYGLPESITTDRGKEFTAGFWTTLAKKLGIKRKLSTAYHPQTDGQTEIVNQWLEQYLRVYTDYTQSDWVELLAHAEICYNSTKHSTTKVSPLFALMGKEPRLTEWDVVIPSEEGDSPAAHERALEMQKLHLEMRDNILKAQEAWQKPYNKKHRDGSFEVGDKVMLSSKHLRSLRPSKKLDHQHLGPFSVVEKINPVAYKLQLPSSMRIHPVFHISLLKPFVARIGASTSEQPFHVEADVPRRPEAILRKRRRKGKSEYLVKWLGYPESDNQWRGRKDLEDFEGGGELLQNQAEEPHKEKSKPGWKGWVMEEVPQTTSARSDKVSTQTSGVRSRAGRKLIPSRRLIGT